MSERTGIPDFFSIVTDKLGQETDARAAAFMDRGRQWDLAHVLKKGGAIIFGHLDLDVEGHHYAAAIHACMNSGAKKVLGVGVLHALTDELQTARVAVAGGAEPATQPAWGFQGSGLDVQTGRTHWHKEFSMLAFGWLYEFEARRRRAQGLPVPELIVRYPWLAGGRPHLMPGLDELKKLVAEGAVLVGTADPFHHGLAYGDSVENSKSPMDGGLQLCERVVTDGFNGLGGGDYWGFNQHCVFAKSDGRDMGQVIRYLMGKPFEAHVLDIGWDDMSGPYGKPAPSWVAGCLITLTPRAPRSSDLH